MGLNSGSSYFVSLHFTVLISKMGIKNKLRTKRGKYVRCQLWTRPGSQEVFVHPWINKQGVMACISQVSHIDMTALVRERSLGVVLLRGWRCLSGPTVSWSWKSHSPGLTERLSVFLPGTFFWDCQQYFRGNVISASPAELELTPAWDQAVPSRDSWCGCRWNLRPLEGTAGPLFHQHQSL